MISAATHIPKIRMANKADAAEFFGVSLPTINSWIAKGCPVVQKGSRGVPWVLDLLEMASWRFGGEATPGDELDPESMSRKERLDHYRGDRERDAHAKEIEHLIPFEVIEQLVGSAFAAVRTTLLAHHNTIANEFPEIPVDAIRGIQRLNKEVLAALAETRLPESISGALDEVK